MIYYIAVDTESPTLSHRNIKMEYKRVSDEIINFFSDRSDCIFLSKESLGLKNEITANNFYPGGNDIRYYKINLDTFISDIKDIVENKGGNHFEIIYPYSSSFNLDLLNVNLEEIEDYIIEKNLLIPNLTGFMVSSKYPKWGYDLSFLSPDGNFYPHPDSYYNYRHKHILCSFPDLPNPLEDSRPSLMCKMCESFYCPRNIYYNKIATGEYMVPSSFECRVNTIFNNHSFSIFEKISGEKIIPSDLDILGNKTFDSEILTTMYFDRMCGTNNIKSNITGEDSWSLV